MRLINVQTLKLHEFFGSAIPRYAILSHRWETEEVTFQDFQAERGQTMKGWSKITGCCTQASKDHLEYAWVDSCCIDKTSSAELSEAINSMFTWYQDAAVCYAYLSDVSISPHDMSDPPTKQPFRNSKWFTRGWTLQELIAPENVVFFNASWVELGRKDTLAQLIKSVTGIHHLFGFHRASVAQRMSWASRRETTRVEDAAYCLMGLFGINMPPLYGEGGRKAFLRLQLEILKASNDESIFAWAAKADHGHLGDSGLLASSPAKFWGSGQYIALDPPPIKRPPYLMTNKGLQIEVHLLKHSAEDSKRGIYMTPLNCAWEGAPSQMIGLRLREHDGTEQGKGNVFMRAKPNSSGICSIPDVPFPEKLLVYINQPQFSLSANLRPLYRFKFTEAILASGYTFEFKSRPRLNPVIANEDDHSKKAHVATSHNVLTCETQYGAFSMEFAVEELPDNQQTYLRKMATKDIPTYSAHYGWTLPIYILSEDSRILVLLEQGMRFYIDIRESEEYGRAIFLLTFDVAAEAEG